MSAKSAMNWPMLYRGRRCRSVMRRGDQTQVRFMDDDSREWVLSSMVEKAKVSRYASYTIKDRK